MDACKTLKAAKKSFIWESNCLSSQIA